MSGLILCHKLTRQPQVPVEIDRSNPIGKKCVAVLYRGGRYNIVGVPGFSATKDGPVVVGAASSMLYKTYEAFSNKNASILYYGEPGTTPGGGFSGAADVTGNHLFILQYENDGGSLRTRALIRTVNAGVVLSKTFPPSLNGVPGAYIATFAPDVDLKCYFNGVDVTQSGSFSGSISTFGQFSTLGLMGIYRPVGGNSYGQSGRGALSAIFGATLTPAEAFTLGKNPWQLLRPMQRRLWAVPAVATGTDNLTATDLVTGSPVLGTPALGQAHALTATGITTPAPALGVPALGQVHGLAATALTVSAPVLGTPAVGQAHSLVASALVVGSPVLDTPSLSENAADVDALTANDLVVGSPVLGTPSFGQIHVLGSDGLTVSSPVLGTPSLEIGKDHLTAQDLVTEGPVLGTPALRQIHALVASFSTAAPEIGAPALTQAHALVPVSLAAGSPVLGTPLLFDLEYMLQTRAELKSLGTTDFTSPLYGATHIELRCYGNYEVNEFGE